MSIGTPYKRARLADSYDTIVVGSGIGGLTVASLLARHAGERVLVLERHYTAGGFTHSFKRPGFDWDVGVHYIGEVHRRGSLLRRIFDHLSDGELEWADMGPVYDRIRVGDRSFDFIAGGRALRAKFIAEFPHERDGIERYFDLVLATNRATLPYFAEKLLPRSLANVVGAAMRAPALRYARKTTREVVHGLVADPVLRAFLTAQWGDYGLPPSQSSFLIHALVAGHYLRGAAYPVGGASRIAETIVPSIERAGGAVVVRAEVERIVVEGGRALGVELVDGRRIVANRVVSNAGAAVTYGRFLPEGVRPARVDANGVGGLAPSVAHLSLYVGLRGEPDELALPKHNVWLYPDPDHDATYARLATDGDRRPEVGFLSFASARDPEFVKRHPGHSTAEVVTFAHDSWFSEWRGTDWCKRGDAYEARKRELGDALLALLLRELPQLRDRVLHTELSTPLSTEHFAGHPRGEIYGLTHSPARFDSDWLRPRTPIDGLYLTGSDVVSAGVGGGLMGGVLTAAALLGSEPRAVLRHLLRRPSPASATSRPIVAAPSHAARTIDPPV